MIGTIRKHSKWLWWVIAGVTIISFVFFMGSGPARNRGGGGGADSGLGNLYGHAVTQDEYLQADNDFELNYLLNEGVWPDKGRVTELERNKQIYGNLMLAEKAKSLGMAVSQQAAVDTAAATLNSPALSRAFGNHSGQPVTMDQLTAALKNHNPPMTAADYEHFIRSRMIVEQMQLTMGLSGALVSPQEASDSYDHEYRTATTEAVFFSADNYLDQVAASPAAVGQFFTNYMADYRYPDRVQVNYVWFNITNYIAQSKAEWAKTNLEEEVSLVYSQDASEFADAKTPDEAKAKIRDLLIKRRAYGDAHQVAQDFVATLFAMTPVSLDNFAAAAKQKGLTVKVSEPFSAEGSAEFANAPDLAKSAFALTPDSPFSDEIAGDDGIYVIGLAQQLPSSMPAFSDISSRVTHDYELMQAAMLARSACTNFWMAASLASATGKTLDQTAKAKGLTVVTPEPFSLSSQEIPEIGEHVDADTYKQVAFAVAPGHISPLIPTRDGAFVMYVKSVSAPDAATKTAQLPQFLTQLRRQRESEAFSIWANEEAAKIFPNIPILSKLMADAQKQQQTQPQ